MGDYILELYGESPQNELCDLDKTAKVYKDDKKGIVNRFLKQIFIIEG